MAEQCFVCLRSPVYFMEKSLREIAHSIVFSPSCFSLSLSSFLFLCFKKYIKVILWHFNMQK